MREIKIPKDLAQVIDDLNRVGNKANLAKLYNCSIPALDNYEKRNKIKFIRNWSVKKI